MSDEDIGETSSQVLTAEYKDGQLQIVEVTPIDNGEKAQEDGMLPSLDGGDEERYTVLDTSKGLVQLDLLNLTFVRCQDGEDGSYQLVASEADVGEDDDRTVTCVVQAGDTEETDNSSSYVIVEGEEGPLVFLQSSLDPPAEQKPAVKKEHLTPVEILERAKALQKAKAAAAPQQSRGRRKRKSDLPPPHELLALPNFKLYLYSCKYCTFKCNAVKEMSAHKAAQHGAGTKPRAGGSASALQCARCPYRGNTHLQLMKHVQDKHNSSKQALNMVHLDSDELAEADVLVCGACGFESSSRADFRIHIEDVHGATTC